MKILLVEDDISLSRVLQKGLKKQGFAVDTAFDGEQAIDFIQYNQYDLIVLDLNIPKKNGFEVLKIIREDSLTIKVLLLSAKNQVEDKIYGLDLGANDYLEKPFDFLELVARIRNLLRWDFTIKETTLTFKGLTINLTKKTILKNNLEIYLTNKEFGILEYLAQNKERYITAEEIIEHVWDSDADLFSNSFKFHLSSLKKKIDIDGLILNSRGKGYQLGVCNNENLKK